MQLEKSGKKLFLDNDSITKSIIIHFQELRKKYSSIGHFIDLKNDTVVFTFPLSSTVTNIVFLGRALHSRIC